MADDKLVDSTQLDSDLTSVANAIRTKGGTSASLAFPAGFVSAIGDIPSGGGGISWGDIALNTAPAGDIVLDVSSVESYAFAYRTGSSEFSVYGPNVTTLGQNTFRGCINMLKAAFPKLISQHLTGYAFYGNSNLEIVDWGLCDVRGNTFTNCGNLTVLILRKSTIQPCANTNVFTGTPYRSGGSGGTIYIPKALYDHLGDGTGNDYKAASNWSVYDGYGTITWAKLEGSPYESLTWWED